MKQQNTDSAGPNPKNSIICCRMATKGHYEGCADFWYNRPEGICRRYRLGLEKDLRGEMFRRLQVCRHNWKGSDDGRKAHIVTYGKTVKQCSEAADVGNKLKKGLGWPESLQTQPPRVKVIQARLKESEEQRKKLVAKIQELNKENERLTHRLYQAEE